LFLPWTKSMFLGLSSGLWHSKLQQVEILSTCICVFSKYLNKLFTCQFKNLTKALTSIIINIDRCQPMLIDISQ
jgi:hypothetical protein